MTGHRSQTGVVSGVAGAAAHVTCACGWMHATEARPTEASALADADLAYTEHVEAGLWPAPPSPLHRVVAL